MASRPQPLALENTLRDLALIRACDIDLSSYVPTAESPERDPKGTDSTNNNVDQSVQLSYEFVRQARAVIKILNKEDVEKQGGRIENVKSALEDTLDGLSRVRE